MQKLYTVFIDALRPESLNHMPFLSSMITKKNVRTELGFSNVCHSSMYTGVYPEKHGRWFIWKRSPKTSPFRWLRMLVIDRLPHNKYTKLGFHLLTKIVRNNTAFFGLPFIGNTPMRYWSEFDVTEKKYWTEEGFISGYPTIFELLKNDNITFEIVGMKQGNQKKLTDDIKYHKLDIESNWNYLWFGEIDPLFHKEGVDSPYVRQRLKYIDESNNSLSKLKNFILLNFNIFEPSNIIC